MSAIKELQEETGTKWFNDNFNFIFAITGVGQCDISWTIYLKKINQED